MPKACHPSIEKLRMTVICDALQDLIPFAQFKKREKHKASMEECYF